MIDYVPVELRSADVPCHHIPLNAAGETIEQLDEIGNQAKVEEAVKGWLQTTIGELEKE